MNYSDEELVFNAQKGDTNAELEIFSRYKNVVSKNCRSFFLIGGDVEDLLQEGMVGLYKAIKNYKPTKNASFLTFANLCIRRQIQSAVKKATSQKNLLLSTALPIGEEVSFDDDEETGFEIIIPSNEPTPDSELISQENIKEIKQQIREKLSQMELKVLANYLNGKNYDEISLKTGLAKKSIDNALTRIKSKLSFLKNIEN